MSESSPENSGSTTPTPETATTPTPKAEGAPQTPEAPREQELEELKGKLEVLRPKDGGHKTIAPTSRDTNEIYDKVYTDIARSRFNTGPLANQGSHLLEISNDQIPKGAVVVEAGCNQGYFMKEILERLKDKGAKVVGFDINPNAVQIAKDAGLDTHVANAATELDFLQDGSVDCFFAMHTTEHLTPEDKVKFLEQVHKKLRVRGRAFIIEPPNIFGLETIKVATQEYLGTSDVGEFDRVMKGKGLIEKMKVWLNGWKVARKLHPSTLGLPWGDAERDAEKILQDNKIGLSVIKELSGAKNFGGGFLNRASVIVLEKPSAPTTPDN